MRTKSKILIIISIFLVSLGMIFFALALQKYRVITGSRAAGKSNVDIIFNDETFGKLNQGFGILLPSIADTEAVNDIKSRYSNTGMYIKIVRPDVDAINHPNFAELQNAGFKWYFAFTTHEIMFDVMQYFYSKYDVEAVAELSDYSKLDPAKVDTLRAAYPKIKFITYSDMFLPREKIREIVHKVEPPKLTAVGISSQQTNEDVFQDIYLIFATFFDAAKDIQGNSTVKIQYPAGSALALSNINIPMSDVKSQARRSGHIASAIVAAIASQAKSTNAPFKYIVAGDITKMSEQDKIILAKYNDFIRNGLDIVWPYAIPANGDPWYNPFLSQSNTDPIMGIIGKKGTSLFGIMFNSRAQNATAHLPGGKDYVSMKGYSNIRGAGNFISSNAILFSPYEVVIFFSPDLSSEVGAIQPTATPANNPTPTTNNQQPTNTPSIAPTPTINPVVAGKLGCDPGPAPYSSNSIWVYNDSNETISNIDADVFRCPYKPGMIEQYKGSFKCEPTCNANEPNCLVGKWDGTVSQQMRNIVLAPKQGRWFTVTTGDCEITQLDVRNDDENNGALECHNVRSANTVNPGEIWPGGISFAIAENATGYNNATQSCPQPTNTPGPTASNTPSPNPTSSPTTTPAATSTPGPTSTPQATNTPQATWTPPPTWTPAPTFTLAPTHTPAPIATLAPPTATLVPQAPTPTPVKNLAVNGQKPGITPWIVVLSPLLLILVGIFL